MKNLRAVPLLLSSILLVSSVLAQTPNDSATNISAHSDAVEAARGPYVRSENGPRSASNADGEENETLAQFPQRRAGMPYPPQMRAARGAYPGTWSSPASDHHAAMGALIGFGVGATAGGLIGASKADSANRGATALIGSLLFGGLGAAFGAAVASFPGPQLHRYRPREDEGYDELGSRHKRRTNRQEASRRAPSRTPDEGQTAAADIPAAP